ncbi:MAG: carboxypeptidase-like regulatory domain-containing protein [Bacteroidales bacterium]|nr:carboxypeptidase-like regulatory domain-containing protein [Bacteroidales bacterium]
MGGFTANIERSFFVSAIVLFLCLCANAQVTKVRGVVTDAANGLPIPFASVYFTGSTIGISTDLEGRYYLETRDESHLELQAGLIGYYTASIKITPGVFTEVNFVLEQNKAELQAAVVKPNNERIKRFLKALDARRDGHNPDKYPEWTVDLYSRTELDATNAEWLVKSSLFHKALAPIEECKDTSAVTGAEYYPILLSETRSVLFHSKPKSLEKEVIKANQITGVDPDNILTRYSGHHLLKANLYDNNISLFNLSLPSPIASYGHPFYDYYLVDSLMVEGRKTYCLRFHPKPLVTSPALDGQIDIDAEDYAIRSARVRLADRSNVNWIRHVDYSMDYTRLPSGRWFPKDETVFIDFSISVSDSSKVVSFLGNRRQWYDTPVFEVEIPEEYRRNDDPVTVVPQEAGFDWPANRPIPLTPREEKIVDAIRQVQESPSYNALYGFTRSLVVGYVEWKDSPIGIGPWIQTVTYNPTEGLHIGTGFRTTRYFNQKIRLAGSIGYGFNDRKIKGGGSVEYVIRRDRTRKLTALFSKDYVQLGQGTGALSGNNMINSLTSHRNDRQSLLMRYGLDYEHEFSRSLSGYFRAERRRVYGNEQVPLYLRDGAVLDYVDASQVRLKARFAWDERINRGFFDKVHIFTRYPVVSLDLTGGIFSMDRKVPVQTGQGLYEDPFIRGEISIDWHIPGTPFGFSMVSINAGTIWGDVPYTFLKLHEGNQGLFSDNTAFSCMQYFEFASDRWANVFFEHNFDGLILGKIPLIRKLDWREILSFKAAFGSIRPSNLEESDIIPVSGMQSLAGAPYYEIGVGLSNILRLFRIDYAWRLSRRNPDGGNSCIKVGMDLNF